MAFGANDLPQVEGNNSADGRRQRRKSAKGVKYVEDPDLSEGEEQFLAEKKKKARQLDYQVREETVNYPILDQIVGRRINKNTGALEYLCKFLGRSYLHLWWLTFEEIELFIPEGYVKSNRVQFFDRKLKREGYLDLDDVDDLEVNKITVEKILSHKIDPLDHLDDQIEKRRQQIPVKTPFPRVTDQFLIENYETLPERLSGIVSKLLNEHGGDIFAQPVDTTEFPEYLNIVNNPIDLGTIAARLSRENFYSGPAAVPLFVADVRLVFTNCMAFNEKGSPIWLIADGLLKTFEKWYYEWILCPSAWLKLIPIGDTFASQSKMEKKFANEAEACYDLWAPWESGCSICRENVDSDQLLLCDRCDGEIHMYCSSPVIKKLPEGEWFCSFCEVRNKFEKLAEQAFSKNTKKRKEELEEDDDGEIDKNTKKESFLPSPRSTAAPVEHIPNVIVESISTERKHNARSKHHHHHHHHKKDEKEKSNAIVKAEPSHPPHSDRATFFLVKWLGMSIRYSTWERPEDIGDDEQIQRYFKFSRVPTQQEIAETTCQLPCCSKRNQLYGNTALARRVCENDRFCTLGFQHIGECSREIQALDKKYGTEEYRVLRMVEQIKAQLFSFHCLLNNHVPDKEVLKRCGAYTNAFVCKKEYLTANLKALQEDGDEDYSDDDASESSEDDMDDEEDEFGMAFQRPVPLPLPMYPGIVEPEDSADEEDDEENEASGKKKPQDEVSEVLGALVEHIALGYETKLEMVQRKSKFNCSFKPPSNSTLKSFTEYCVPVQKTPLGLGMRLGVSEYGTASVLGFQNLPNGMIGPAQATGVITVGDVLMAVNKVSVANMQFREIVGLIGSCKDFVLFHFHSQNAAFRYPPICQARAVTLEEEEIHEDALDESEYIPFSYNKFKQILKVGSFSASVTAALIPDEKNYIAPDGPMQHLYAGIVDNTIDPHEHFASFLPARPKKEKKETAEGEEDDDEKKKDKNEFIPYEQSPTFKGGRTLRAYQVEGLNWMITCWKQQRSCILADEMGLGKTVQVVSFIEHLKTEESIRGPFLIVVPLSTIQHWRREIESWTDLNVCVYHDIGDRNTRFTAKDMRAIIRDQEWYYPGLGNRVFKFNILLTTYETILADFEEFEHIHWRLIAVDEAHRLKSHGSRVLKQMRVLHCDRKLLLTGTPLQNNTQELWVLLNYLDPVKFDSMDDFNDKFGKLQTQEQVVDLQKLVAPYILRRVKEDVEKSIPPKEETIIAVELTTLQKQYYRAIYDKNKSFLYRGTKNGLPTLNNIQLQLRKCCNHPFLIKGVEERELQELGDNPNPEEVMEKTVASSGKFVLVSKLLPKLKQEGHKVLIFSQFLKQLDLLERYCEYKGFGYERLDGSTSGSFRQNAIDRFSRPNSKTFVFLLSTKAGGVGINLIAADTVIIFDSDWNPQNDLQAQARCHRIGQKKSVQIYRLVTRNTYESEMFDRASRKLGLEHAILGTASFSETSQVEKPSAEQLVELLKRGAYALMEEDDDTASKEFFNRDIETILKENARVHVVNQTSKGTASGEDSDDDEENDDEDDDEEGEDGEKKPVKKRKKSKGRKESFAEKAKKRKSLGGMAVDRSSFVAEDGSRELDVDDPNFWEKVLPGSITIEMIGHQLEDGTALATHQTKSKFIKSIGAAITKLVKEMQQNALDEDEDTQKNLAREYDHSIQLLHRVSTKFRKQFTSQQLEQIRNYLDKLEKTRVRKARVNAPTSDFGSPAGIPFGAPAKKKRRKSSAKSRSVTAAAVAAMSNLSEDEYVISSDGEDDDDEEEANGTGKKQNKQTATAGTKRKQTSLDKPPKKQKKNTLGTAAFDSPAAFPGAVINDSNDLCILCGDGGLILLCDGPCHRSFHLECVGMTSEPTDERWLCPDCTAGRHMCLICKNVGDMGAEFGVLQCSMAKCGRFYHKSCLVNHPKVEWVGKKRFRCPSHFCHACDEKEEPISVVTNKKGNKKTSQKIKQKKKNGTAAVVGYTGVISCLHCSQSFHAKCIQQTEKYIRLSHNLMICADHYKNLPKKKNIISQGNSTSNTIAVVSPTPTNTIPPTSNTKQQQQTQKTESITSSSSKRNNRSIVDSQEDPEDKLEPEPALPSVKLCALCHLGEGEVTKNTKIKINNQMDDVFLDTPVRVQFADKSVEMVYVHLNCALHSAEVYVKSDGTFCNLTRAIKRGRQLRCTKCKQFGATVGCVQEKCRCNYHLHCALETGGEFLGSAYTLYCATHAEQKKKEPTKFCVCETEDRTDKSLTLKCAQCIGQYHPSCVNLSGRQAAKASKEVWYCPKCVKVIEPSTTTSEKNDQKSNKKNKRQASEEEEEEEKPVQQEKKSRRGRVLKRTSRDYDIDSSDFLRENDSEDDLSDAV